MVGNPFIPAATLCGMAMHATILTTLPRNIVAEETYHSHVEHHHSRRKNKPKRRKRHLRIRHSESQPSARQSRLYYAEEKERRAISANTESDGTGRILSSCQWYPDPEVQDACSNKPSPFVEEWLKNSQTAAMMLSPTGEACCAKFFEGRDCTLYGDDSCGDQTSPTSSSSSSSSSSNSASCHWYPDPEMKDACSNKPSPIVEEWLKNSQTAEMMLSSTGEACCNKFYAGRECKFHEDNGCGSSGSDNNGPPNPPKAPCSTPGWYADSKHRDGCTNADTYPKEWLAHGMKDMMFFESFEACCNTFFEGGVGCKMHDVGCTIDSTIGGQPQVGGGSCESEWHPDTQTKSGCANDSSCKCVFFALSKRSFIHFACLIIKSKYLCLDTLNQYYVDPPSWRDEQNRDTYFFTDAEDCCRKYLTVDTTTCQLRNACNGNAITTMHITSKPTSAPTKFRECMWHPSVSASMACDYSDKYSQDLMDPDGSSMFLFNSHSECCQKTFEMPSCGRHVVCDTLAPTLSPTTEEVCITVILHWLTLYIFFFF